MVKRFLFLFCRKWKFFIHQIFLMLERIITAMIMMMAHAVERCVISTQVCVLKPSSSPYCTQLRLCWGWWVMAWCWWCCGRRGEHGVWQMSSSYTWAWLTCCYSSPCHSGQWMQWMDGALAPVSASSLECCLRWEGIKVGSLLCSLCFPMLTVIAIYVYT